MSNCGKQNPAGSQVHGSRSTLSQKSDNSQFHIIKSNDFNRNKRSVQGTHTNDQVCLTGPRLSSNNKALDEKQNTNMSGGSIIKFKRKVRCPMCYGSSAAYYCTDCVRNGNFYHSSVKLPERFAEKRLRERRLRQHIASLEQKAPFEMARRSKKENLRKDIENLKEKNYLMKKVIENEKKKIEKAQEEENVLKSQISHLQKTIPLFQRKNANILQNIILYSQRIPAKKEKIEEFEKDFKVLAREKINKLTSIIFPVSKIPPETSSVEDNQDPVNEETVKELAEALQTHYVRGRWITTSHFAQRRNYSILSMILPGSDDYASFIRPQNEEVSEKHEAQNICAGLTYLCQLVNIMAFYLGTHLPKKISFSDFSDFSRQEMSERKFQMLVSRLNANVIYLCVSQGVPPNLLHPLRAMPNIMALLTERQADLGRMRSFEFPDCIIDNLEEAGCYEDVPDSDSDDDWETVSNVPLPEFSSPPPSGTYFRRTSLDETASGIVTTAAASVMSIFRGIGNPMK